MIDIHCHIVPGVDDGSPDLETSEAMLQAALSVGITHMVCTPHARWDGFSEEAVHASFNELYPCACTQGVRMALGYEVNWKKLGELGLNYAPRLKMGKSNYFLLEFSDDALTPKWPELISALLKQQLIPIIAHPERYADIQKNPRILAKMRDMGCYAVVSANYCAGGTFSARKKAAQKLFSQGLVDLIASDAHRPRDYEMLYKAFEYAARCKWSPNRALEYALTHA